LLQVSMSLLLCATAVSGYTLSLGALQTRTMGTSREQARVAADAQMTLAIDLKGKTVFVAGVADSTGYGWAICKVSTAVAVSAGETVGSRGGPHQLQVTIQHCPSLHASSEACLHRGAFWRSRSLALSAQALANAGATITVGTWPPVLGIFKKSLSSGKFDDDMVLNDGSKMVIEKIYPLDAVFDTAADVPADVLANKRCESSTAAQSLSACPRQLVAAPANTDPATAIGA
jgi:hypothetical protein